MSRTRVWMALLLLLFLTGCGTLVAAPFKVTGAAISTVGEMLD